MPDMAQFNDVQKLLLELLGSSLFQDEPPVLPEHPGALWQEAMMQGVFLLTLQNADTREMGQAQREKMRETVKTTLGANLRLAEGHVLISRILEDAGIPHVLIKGLASAIWYPAPELRQLGDIDFYVDPQNVEKTEALLTEAGFVPEKLSHGVHHVFVKDGLRYELHFSVPGMPEGEAGEICRKYFSDLTERAEMRNTDFGALRLPDPFHHGLILLLHTAHHLTNSGIGLRHLCDWAVFIAEAEKNESLSVPFSEALSKLGLGRLAAALTDVSRRYLGCPAEEDAALKDEALSDELLEDMLSGGNLGQKDVSRSRQAYLITSGTGSDSKVRRLFTVLLDMIYQKLPITKKVKILIPFGWAFYATRYLVRVLRGKRPKLYVKAALQGAQTRTALYDRLRLFECEKENV